LSARTAAATSGSEETAGRSRLTSNRRFASGSRPGWLRPREVSPSRTSANRWSHRPSLPLVARRPTGASSCRPMTTAKRFRCRPTSWPRSTSTASHRRRTRGVEASGTSDWDAVSADARKTPSQRGSHAFRERFFGARKNGPPAHEPLIIWESVATVALAGLSFVRKIIEPPFVGVLLELPIPRLGVEPIKPLTKRRQVGP
jgi:hypothetical protein